MARGAHPHPRRCSLPLRAGGPSEPFVLPGCRAGPGGSADTGSPQGQSSAASRRWGLGGALSTSLSHHQSEREKEKRIQKPHTSVHTHTHTQPYGKTETSSWSQRGWGPLMRSAPSCPSVDLVLAECLAAARTPRNFPIIPLLACNVLLYAISKSFPFPPTHVRLSVSSV